MKKGRKKIKNKIKIKNNLTLIVDISQLLMHLYLIKKKKDKLFLIKKYLTLILWSYWQFLKNKNLKNIYKQIRHVSKKDGKNKRKNMYIQG